MALPQNTPYGALVPLPLSHAVASVVFLASAISASRCGARLSQFCDASIENCTNARSCWLRIVGPASVGLA